MSEIHDPYDDQLRAARYRAERDQAREELDRAGRRIRGLESALQEARCTRAKDREAAEWVRGHGGLDTVGKQWELREDVAGIVGEALWGTPDRVPDDLDEDELRAELLSRLMPAGYEWDDRLSGAVEFFEAAHDLLYTVDCEDDHDGPEMVQEVMRRLMPEGMEWPRYDSGEKVEFGNTAVVTTHDEDGDRAESIEVSGICLDRETFTLVDGSGKSVICLLGERVNRPEPGPSDSWERLEMDAHEERVNRPEPGPSDSWERLEMDAHERSGVYCHFYGLPADEGPWPSDWRTMPEHLMAVDLVRRAKALAEKE